MDPNTIAYGVGIAVGAMLAVALILLPTIVAFTRKTRNRRKLALANVLLCWVPFAPLVLLIFAFTSVKEGAAPTRAVHPVAS